MNMQEALKQLEARNPKFSWGIMQNVEGNPAIHFQSLDGGYLADDPYKDGNELPTDPLAAWGLDHESAEIMRAANVAR